MAGRSKLKNDLRFAIDDCLSRSISICSGYLRTRSSDSVSIQSSILNRNSSIVNRPWLAAGLACCLFLTPLAGVELQRFEYSADAMGGVFSLALYSGTRAAADAASAAAFVELRRLDHMLSNYRADSEWSKVNRDAAAQAVKVSRELFDLLSACLEYSRRSEGAFDITVGPLMKAWGFHGGSGSIAEDVLLNHVRTCVGYQHILLDPEGCAVRFDRDGVEMDPGGIGKGYAVDRMIETLKQHGIERALVSAAGSSIFALGAPPGQEGWLVDVHGPDLACCTADPLLLKDESLSTSGISQRNFRSNGLIFGHILDPRSGYPVRGVLQVTVRAPRAIDSEAWTKAFFVNGQGWSAIHIPGGFRAFFCSEAGRRPTCEWLP
jgi:thiamine biosynthesis lipoprotein